MKVVLDTNVLVSGLLSPSQSPGQIVQMVSSGTLTLCYDARILTEYRAVLLRPKFSFHVEHVDALLDQIRFCGVSIAAGPLSRNLPDIHDEPFLEVAVSGRAKCLITGNLKHYPVSNREGVAVLSPAEFLAFYRKK